MSTLTLQDAINQMLAALDEGLSGPPEAFAYYSDRGPDAGLRKLLESIDAPTASKPIAGSSIAGQVSHVIFGLDACRQFIEGTAKRFDWASSWEPSQVDADSWRALRERLVTAHETLCAAVAAGAAQSLPSLGATLSAVTHVAYHLGVIRQKWILLQAAAPTASTTVEKKND